MITPLRTIARETMCVVTASAFLAFTTSPAHAACTKDTDCKGDRVCESGACVSPSARPAAPHDATPAPGSSAPADAATPSTPPAQASEPAPPSPPPSGIRYEPAEPAAASPGPASSAAAPTTPPQASKPAEEPAHDTVELWISTESHDSSFVSFQGSDGAHAEGCQAPCTLRVKPGRGTLYVRGSQVYEQEIVVPAHGTNVTLTTKSCPWCFVLAGTAFVAAGISAYLAVRSFDDVPVCTPYSGLDQTFCNDDRATFTLYGVIFTGGAVGMAVAGILTLARGVSQAGSKAVLPDEAMALRRVRLAGASVIPLRDGGAGTLRFTF